MKVLVIGGDGMLGHELLRSLAGDFEVRVTLRREASLYSGFGLFNDGNSYGGVDIRLPATLMNVLCAFRPDVVVNAAGVVKQRTEGADVPSMIRVNALFPHTLGQMAALAGTRVIHVSTDCVFSGQRGCYSEDDLPDPVDVYGRTKLLGELDEAHCLTLRTSMIGLELGRRQGLVEWALAQAGSIPGYTRVPYGGLTTMELARVISVVVASHADLHGVWHLSSEPITKYELLRALLARLDRHDVTVVPVDDVALDRTLCSARFEKATGYVAPSWDTMLGELADRIVEREGAAS